MYLMSLKDELLKLDAISACGAMDDYFSRMQALHDVSQERVVDEAGQLAERYPGLNALITKSCQIEVLDDMTLEQSMFLAMGAALAINTLVELAEVQELPPL